MIYTQAEHFFTERLNQHLKDHQLLGSDLEKSVALVEKEKNELDMVSKEEMSEEVRQGPELKAEEVIMPSAESREILMAKVEEHKKLLEEHKTINKQYLEFATEALRGKISEAEALRDEVLEESNKVNQEYQKMKREMKGVDEKLETTEAKNKILERKIVLGYLEVSQRARGTGHKDLFGQKQAPEGGRITGLATAVKRFVERLKQRLGFGAVPEEKLPPVAPELRASRGFSSRK